MYQSYEVWASGLSYSKGQIVTGSNSVTYRSLSHHLSAAASEPVSGADTATYWTTPAFQGGVWAANLHYDVGMTVVGTDSKIYTCKRRHVTASGIRPVTGGTYTSYWALTQPGVSRARRPNGIIEMQPNIANNGKRLGVPKNVGAKRVTKPKGRGGA